MLFHLFIILTVKQMLHRIKMLKMKTTQNTINSQLTKSSPGILVIGGTSSPFPSSSAANSVELWTPAAPEESCTLPHYPRDMDYGPTVNFVAKQLVACNDDSCEKYDDNNGWTKIADTRDRRLFHSSAQHEDRILLIGGLSSGGLSSNSTEWIPADGGDSQIGPWVVRHGRDHCTIQVSSDLIVVTGGVDADDYVTEYQLNGNATETEMTALITGRRRHACGVYREAGGQQVRISW